MGEIQTSPSALMYSPSCHTTFWKLEEYSEELLPKSGFILVLFLNVAHFWRQGTWLGGVLAWPGMVIYENVSYLFVFLRQCNFIAQWQSVLCSESWRSGQSFCGFFCDSYGLEKMLDPEKQIKVASLQCAQSFWAKPSAVLNQQKPTGTHWNIHQPQ